MEFLETKRLIIRRFKESDWQDLYEYLSDEEVVKFEPYDVFSVEKSKKEAIKRAENKIFYAVVLKEENKVIGNLSFIKEEFDTWELGYVFNRKYQGKGYATESAEELVKYAFEKMNARRIIAMCSPENKPSWKLMKRLNMRRESLHLQNVYFKKDNDGNPIWLDTYEYAILKSEYENLNIKK